MKFLAYIFFRVLIGLFSLLPFKLLYLLSDLLNFILKHLFKYRTAVIETNLSYCFPHKSKQEIASIANSFYRNFIDIILESIKGLGTPPKKLVPRYTFRNPELMDAHFERGEHVIIYSQHYNNWEWAPLCLGLQMKHHLVGAVKMLSNQYINEYMKAGRSGNNVSVIPTYYTAKFFSKLDEEPKPVGIVFIADQKPSGKERAVEMDFLGQQVSFHGGAAKYGIKSGLAIFSLDVHRMGRGRYEVEAVQLAKAGELTSADQLTARYIQNLERLITTSPQSWLWSHKRFKNKISY